MVMNASRPVRFVIVIGIATVAGALVALAFPSQGFPLYPVASGVAGGVLSRVVVPRRRMPVSVDRQA